jgi:ABC-type multidrug transport system fused ATPase/permease subunit
MRSINRSILTTIVDGVSVLGPGWSRLASLLSLYILTTLFEGFGLGMMLPIADLLQKGQIDQIPTDGYWRYLALFSEWAGVPLTLPSLLVTTLLLFMVRNSLMYARSVTLSRRLQKSIRDNRVKGFELFLRSGMGYQDRMSAGRIINDLTSQVAIASSAIYSSVLLTHTAFMAAFYIAFLLIMSWKLTLSIMVVIVVAAACVRPITQRSRAVGDELVQLNQSISGFVAERIGAARLIRLARMERGEIDEMLTRTTQQAGAEVTLVRNSSRTSAIIETFVMSCGLALLYFGTSVLHLELVTIGLSLAILLRQLPVTREFIITRQAILANSPAIIHTVALFREMDAAAEPDSGLRDVVGLTRAIVLRNVVFRYGAESEPALRGISVTFPAGKMTALVGPSGGGKSTLIDLIPRLREPQKGEIFFDDVPIREFSQSALRKQIAYTPQAPQIFNLTVAQHIRYGKLDASDAEVQEAARQAGADAFIRTWPNHYNTLLGERGVRLSGGQKQRIDLARALVSGAAVLILDEPTSNVDAETEYNFQQTLSHLREVSGRTIIVVGHRLSTIRNADQIVVINDGLAIERGTHQELMDRNGWYSGAFRLQARGASEQPLSKSSSEEVA